MNVRNSTEAFKAFALLNIPFIYKILCFLFATKSSRSRMWCGGIFISHEWKIVAGKRRCPIVVARIVDLARPFRHCTPVFSHSYTGEKISGTKAPKEREFNSVCMCYSNIYPESRTFNAPHIFLPLTFTLVSLFSFSFQMSRIFLVMWKESQLPRTILGHCDIFSNSLLYTFRRPFGLAMLFALIERNNKLFDIFILSIYPSSRFLISVYD